MAEEKIKIHCAGYEKVIVDNHSDRVWTPEPKIEEKVEKIWEEKLAKSDNLWSAPMVRLDSYDLKGNRLILNTSVTDFKHHVGTRKEDNLEDRANPVYVSANIVTEDGNLVFGLRDNSERGNNQYNIAAGAVHPDLDSPDGIPSLGVALYREVFEEFGLVPESFKHVRPMMLFGMESEQHGSFLYTIRLKIDSEDVKRKLDAAIKRAEDFGMKPEMVDLKFLKYDINHIKNEIDNNGDNYRPAVRVMLNYISER